MNHPRSTLGALALCLALALAACGDSDSDGDSAAADDASTSTEETDSEESEVEDSEVGDETDEGDVEPADDGGDDSTDDETSAEAENPEIELGEVGDVTFVAPFEGASAAVVDGTEVPGEVLFNELDQQVIARVATGADPSTLQDADGAYEVGLMSSVLSDLIVSEIVKVENENRGLEITDDLRTEVSQGIGDAPEGVSGEFIDAIIERQAGYQLLAEDLASTTDPADSLQCSRHVLLDTEPEALEVIERLEADEDFAEVAAEVSVDTSAAQNGGSLGCDVSSFVPAFASAVEALEVGNRSDPVETDFGFHVIEKLEPTEADLALATQGLGQAAFRDWVIENVGASDVELDERLGTWDPVEGVIPAGTQLPDQE